MIRPAITAAALLVLLAPNLAAGAPTGTRTYQGTIQDLAPRAGTLSLTCGVGMALRIVHIRISPATQGLAERPGSKTIPWKRGDVVRVECHVTSAGPVADRLDRVVTP